MRWIGLPRSLVRAAGSGAVELSPLARDRLRALTLWEESGNVKWVCRTFEVSRATLYRWRNRFDPRRLDDPGGAHAPASPGETAHVVG